MAPYKFRTSTSKKVSVRECEVQYVISYFSKLRRHKAKFDNRQFVSFVNIIKLAIAKRFPFFLNIVAKYQHNFSEFH